MTTVNCKREGGYNWTKWAAKLERQLGGLTHRFVALANRSCVVPKNEINKKPIRVLLDLQSQRILRPGNIKAKVTTDN